MPTIKFLFFFCLLSYAAPSGAQNRSATSEEAKAIRQAIDNETKAIENCDYEAWASYWAHEDYCYFSVTGPNWHWSMKGSDKLGLFVAGHASDGFSHVNHGSAMLDDDGTLIQKPKKPNSDQLAETSWMSPTDDGKLRLKVETYDDEGKVDLQFSAILNRR